MGPIFKIFKGLESLNKCSSINLIAQDQSKRTQNETLADINLTCTSYSHQGLMNLTILINFGMLVLLQEISPG